MQWEGLAHLKPHTKAQDNVGAQNLRVRYYYTRKRQLTHPGVIQLDRHVLPLVLCGAKDTLSHPVHVLGEPLASRSDYHRSQCGRCRDEVNTLKP